MCLQPSVDAMLESASGTVVGKRLSVREAKPVIQDYGTSQTHICLGTRAFTNAVAGLKAEGTSVEPDSGAEEGGRTGRGGKRVSCYWPKIAEQEGVVAPVAFARRTLWQERAWMRTE